ncbi:hypothetical protein MBRA_05877 [Methylobacterium brachiatum]|nr:hypothetical protein MBRA_05877 [Methylobacterium brachiatum]
MADEALRMQAEVVDRFSGPLKALRAQLLDTSRQGAAHGETLAKGLGRVEGAARSAGQAAQTVLNPALATIGVTSLGTGVAVAGVVNALNSLSGSLSSLGQLGREIGANGSVNVLVQKPGPETSVRTSASDNLFKDVVLQRGRTMVPAGGT